MHVTYIVVMFLGLGNVFCSTVFGLTLFLLVEYPVQKCLQLVGLKKACSSDALLQERVARLGEWRKSMII